MQLCFVGRRRGVFKVFKEDQQEKETALVMTKEYLFLSWRQTFEVNAVMNKRWERMKRDAPRVEGVEGDASSDTRPACKVDKKKTTSCMTFSSLTKIYNNSNHEPGQELI